MAGNTSEALTPGIFKIMIKLYEHAKTALGDS
jgi:hypothetical protein